MDKTERARELSFIVYPLRKRYQGPIKATTGPHDWDVNSEKKGKGNENFARE